MKSYFKFLYDTFLKYLFNATIKPHELIGLLTFIDGSIVRIKFNSCTNSPIDELRKYVNCNSVLFDIDKNKEFSCNNKNIIRMEIE